MDAGVWENRLTAESVMAIVLGSDPKGAFVQARRKCKLGFTLLEVSWITPNLTSLFQILTAKIGSVGNGTVLTVLQARNAVGAGGGLLTLSVGQVAMERREISRIAGGRGSQS